MSKSIKIIGIGASAGGLRAINEFFDNISDTTGMAFVVVQHLSPDFKSMMDELLTKHTNMPIQVVTEPTEVQANHIYLISSKANIILKNDRLDIIERSDPKHLNLPINLFFHSLGKEKKELAVGVILSGTGSDGSKGILTIHEHGGLVMVETPSHAQFDGMPVSALSSGVVDYILSPSAMAKQLERLADGKTNEKNFIILNPEGESFQHFFNLIIKELEIKTQVNFTNYRKNTLVRRMEKRMLLSKFDNLEAYYNFLKNSSNEAEILKNEFLIGVTHFYRDLEAFEVLQNEVIPNLFANKKPNEQIRVWVPACSTGQEAVSLAILFREYMEEHRITNPLKIFASDINKKAVGIASQGVYHISIIKNLPTKLLNKYFSMTSDTEYTLLPTLRENIVYTIHNAIYDPPFINMDLISCRNMIIYLDHPIQATLLANFHFALNYHAFLFLGPSESLGTVKKAFLPISTKWNIFRNIQQEKMHFNLHKGYSTGARMQMELQDTSQQLSLKSIQPRNVIHSEKNLVRAVIEQFAPTFIIIDEHLNILMTNGRVDEILGFPRVSGRFNLEEMVDADELIFFKNGIRKCTDTTGVFRYKEVEFKKQNELLKVEVQISSLPSLSNNNTKIFCIEFYSSDEINETKTVQPSEIITRDKFQFEKLKTVQQQLQIARKEKQFLVEQLETTNEELQSSNEELLAGNEELQSTNEELQSVNEELYTVNTELQNKVNELITITNDLDNLLNSTEIGTIFLDNALTIRRFTPAIIKQFNLLESDIGRPITNFANSFLDKEIYTSIQNVVKELEPFEKEIKDDKGNYYLMRVLPYKTEADRIDGAVLTFIPINELKNADRELEEAGQRYRAIFENSYDNIILTDKDAVVTSSNYEFAGKSKEQLIGMSITDLFPPDYKLLFEDSIKSVSEGNRLSGVEFELQDEEGNKLWFSTTITPVVVRQEITHFAFITKDITQLKSKELELKQFSLSLEKQVRERATELAERNTELSEINHYLDSFVHGAAHDLRSPIVRMKGLFSLLDQVDDVEKKETLYLQVSKNVGQLEKTLNGLIEMIDFQKNDNRKTQKIDVEKKILEVKESLENEIKESNGEISLTIDPTVNLTYTPAYFTSIIYNLLSNAIKYRNYERDLEVSITVLQEEEFVKIEIQDNGIGIDMNRYGHLLFQPFKRLIIEREGTGIGLSIINNVVKKNGGRIEVESKLTEGTKFSVFLKSKRVYEQVAEA